MTKFYDQQLSHTKPYRLGALSLLVLAISACSPIEVQRGEPTQLPEGWSQRDFVASVDVPEPNNSADVNHGFKEEALAKLIDEALANNLSLQQAKLRIKTAEQGLLAANAARGVNVAASSGVSRMNLSEAAFPVGNDAVYNDFSLTGKVSYNLDIWGKQAAMVDAQTANIRAAEARTGAARLSLTSAIARAFYATKYSQSQLTLLLALKKVEMETLAAKRDQVNLGYDTADALTEANLDNIAIDNQLIVAKAAYRANQRALAYLAGRPPLEFVKGVELGDTPLDKLHIPWTFPNLPSEVIARRPDIQLAQADMDASYAQAKIANTAHLPNFALTSQLGLQSAALGDFISAPAIFWNMASSASATLFDGGAIKAQQATGQLNYEGTELAYQSQIYLAFKETQDALAAYDSERLQWQNQIKLLNNQTKLYKQEQSRFELGQTPPVVALAVKKAWLSSQLAYLTGRFQLLNASVDLYQALGGPVPD